MDTWFKARISWRGGIEELSDAEAGRFAKALWRYAASGEVESLSGGERFVFSMCKATLDEDREDRSDLSAARSKAGKQGGRPKKAIENIESKKSNCFSEKASESKKSNCDNKNKSKNKSQNQNSAGAEWLDDDEADEITEGHHQVFDRAESWGFELNTRTMDSLTELIATHGVDKLLAALDECGKHGAKTLAYLIAVLDGKPKAAQVAEPERRMQRLF